MERWSRYNYMVNSDKIGKFIYNTRTNSFTRVNDTLFDILDKKDKDLTLLNDNIKEKFKELKIIVNDNEDDDFYYNKKFVKYSSAFAMDHLGLTIATTTHCNFRCPYCYEEGAVRETSNKEIDDAIIKFIDKNKAKNVHITLYGESFC